MTRNYSSSAAATTLAAACNDVTTSIQVTATTGFPSAPFTLVIDSGTVDQEIVLVTSVGGTTLTVTRGYDSTSAMAHDLGATVQHCHAAIDFREAANHVGGTTDVHGVTGDVVGTSDTQTLSNKTIALANNMVTGTAAQLNAAITDTDVATTDGAQTLTNKTLSLGSNTVSMTKAQLNSAVSDADVATLTGTETLTNKTVNLTSNTLVTTKAQLDSAVSDADLASLAGAETLTNKTLALGSNTVSGTKAQFDTALTDGDFATLAGTETLTNKTLTSPTVNTPSISSPTLSGNLNLSTVTRTDDTGWKAVTYQNSITDYDAAGGNDMKYRRVGNTVHLVGQMKPGTSGNASSIGGTAGVVAFTLPSGYRPSRAMPNAFRCQGSTNDDWCLQVDGATGNVVICRYDGSTNSGTWLPVCVNFLTDDAFPA